MPKLNLPAPLVLLLGLLGGVLEFLNQQTFHFVYPWQQLVTYGLLIIGLLGVSPLVGKAFITALKLPVWVSVALTIIATAIAAAITTFSISGVLAGVLLGVVAFLSFIGVGPESVEDLAAKAGYSKPVAAPISPITPAKARR